MKKPLLRSHLEDVASIAPAVEPQPKEISFYSGTAGYVRFYNGMSVRIRPTGPVQLEGSPEMLKNLTADDWELYTTLALKYADEARSAIKRFSENGEQPTGVIKFESVGRNR